MPSIVDALPELYRGFLPDFFTREIPVERKATCASCAMCESSATNVVAAIDGRSRLFRPDTKCCTYFPRLPNYLVGALLSDTRPALARGRERVRERIAKRDGVSPQWVSAPALYSLLYDKARGAFGHAEALRCPYFDTSDGGCTIWPYREAVCSTFYCKYVAGADGRRFWMSLKSYVSLAEVQLSRYALHVVAPALMLSEYERGRADDGTLRTSDLDSLGPDPSVYRTWWSLHEGREEKLYRDCFDVVRTLSHDDFERLIGFDGVAAGTLLAKLHDLATTDDLPKVLRLDPGATVQWLADGSVALASYSEYDAVALPGEAYALLAEFRGDETVERVRERLRDEKHADVMPDVLRELYRHRVLVAG